MLSCKQKSLMAVWEELSVIVCELTGQKPVHTGLSTMSHVLNNKLKSCVTGIGGHCQVIQISMDSCCAHSFLLGFQRLFLCVLVFCLHTCLCTTCVPGEGVGSPGTALTWL